MELANNIFISNFDMVKFAQRIIVALLAALVVCIMLDYCLSSYLKNSGGRKYDTWAKIVDQDLKDVDLLIFGGSRAYVQYSPAILDSILGVYSFNMGIDGSGCNRHILRWNIYCRFKNNKPKYIIHNVDYFATFVKTIGYERDQYFPYFWNPAFRTEVFEDETFSFFEKYIPMYRYSQYGVRNILEVDTPLMYKGYDGVQLKWNDDEYNKIDSIEYDLNPDAVCLFEQYIQDVQSREIKLIFVMSPTYFGTKEKFTQLDLMYSTYSRLSEKYNIPLLDYTFCELSKDTTLFYNAMHLNKEGSELFSIQLANDLKERGLITE